MYLENRLIAMLDVLGFSGHIETREEMELTSKKYSGLVLEAQKHMFEPKPVPGSPQLSEPNFEYGKFVFDTLIFVSCPIDDNDKAIYRFIFATIFLMEKFFAEGFPLRGSIDKGDLCENETTNIFLSNVFKGLHTDEADQQWTGCVLRPNVTELVTLSLLGHMEPHKLSRSSPLHYIRIPRKKAKNEEEWCLNWSHFLSPLSLELGLEHMNGDKKKKEETKQYLESLCQLTDDTQVLPLEFKPAKRMRFMKARQGCRVKLEDDDGQGVHPGCGD